MYVCIFFFKKSFILLDGTDGGSFGKGRTHLLWAEVPPQIRADSLCSQAGCLGPVLDDPQGLWQQLIRKQPINHL